MRVEILNDEKTEEVTDVLCESFYNYPTMKYILGENDTYNNRLRKLVKFFVYARLLRHEPMLGIANPQDKLVAAALISLPGEIPTPNELLEKIVKLWQDLGVETQDRYANFETNTLSFFPQKPHHHLHMIGVRKAYQWKGIGHQLMDAVEELVSQHPTSIGLSLSTEYKPNVKFYMHLGYKLLGKVEIDKDFVSWGFFKSKN